MRRVLARGVSLAVIARTKVRLRRRRDERSHRQERQRDECHGYAVQALISFMWSVREAGQF